VADALISQQGTGVVPTVGSGIGVPLESAEFGEGVNPLVGVVRVFRVCLVLWIEGPVLVLGGLTS
jgi:hypothetical protein